MALIELVEKAADADLVREMLAFAAERIMDAEAEMLTGAAKGARTALRENHRNGCREWDWDTRAGRIELAIPKLRKGSYFPSFLEPRRTAEKALVAFAIVSRTNGVPMAHSRKPMSTASRRGPWTTCEGHGRGRHVEEPGEPALRRDRRAGERLSAAAAGRRLALAIGLEPMAPRWLASGSTPPTSRSARAAGSSAGQ